MAAGTGVQSPRAPRSVPETLRSIRADGALMFACQARLLLPLEQTALDLFDPRIETVPRNRRGGSAAMVRGHQVGRFMRGRFVAREVHARR